MAITSELTHISLITLIVIFGSALSWLILRTLKEGREALKEVSKDKS